MCNLRTIKHQGHISVLHIEGGSPGRGFVSGLTSSLTASSVQNLGGGKIATVIGGSLSGGVGAAVVDGNFYEGAVFGLMVSSLNHVAHEISEGWPPKNAKSRSAEIAQKERNEQDNNYNFFYDENDISLRSSVEWLYDGGANSNTIAINSHGNAEIITTPEGRMDPQKLHNYLYKYNKLYRNSFDSKSTINLHINACSTGNGFAQKLTLINPYINVRAPNTNLYGPFNILQGDQGKMLWFNNGKIIN